ncbi:helix-turn-helix domain-containing protein [Nocardioides plantarum]|uniref:Helix-turn-helix domain-containing protein n=1 Tax=Nocardioides plantarum TaxID=29299 RepID=A0ABV5KB42_9ACTN|nr:helix-turn-helix transcriptional regulator [Nocardioides plantarum]
MSGLDQDTEQVVAALRNAVTTSGMSQAGFARSMGTSPSRMSTYLTGRTRPSAWFCSRAQRVAHALQAAARRGLMSAPDTASAMLQHGAAGDQDWVWRMLLQGRDHLAMILGDGDETLTGSWEAEPGSAGSMEWDTLLAALAAHEYERVGREAPAWTRAERLEVSWMPEHPFLSPDRVAAQTPDWLRILNIFVPARDLVTA